MKKILVLLALVGAGFWYYKNVYSLPIYGTWVANEKEFMRKAYEKSAMTPAQEQKVRSYISNTRVTIERGGNIAFKFPNQEGSFSYKLDRSSAGCYSLDITEIGLFEGCVEGASLKMRNVSNGVVEIYDRI